MGQLIKDWLLNDVADDRIVAMWNDFVVATDRYDGEIHHSLEDLVEMLGDDAIVFARRVYFGDVANWGDPYFRLNVYGNVESFMSLLGGNSPVDFNELAEWLVENAAEYEEIAELLDEAAEAEG